jgi:poly(3-hydroxybutyrate) depolymerase
MKSLCILLFAGLVLSALSQALQKYESITADGLKRKFITYIPAGIGAADKPPVIISLHGRLGTAGRQMKFADFRSIADREKIIIVCPQGIDRSWNDGRHTWPGGSQYLPEFIIGPVTKNLDACEEIWKFFKQNRLNYEPVLFNLFG